MPKVEYLALTFIVDNSETLTGLLNEKADEGWRLFSVTPSGRGGYFAVFERAPQPLPVYVYEASLIDVSA